MGTRFSFAYDMSAHTVTEGGSTLATRCTETHGRGYYGLRGATLIRTQAGRVATSWRTWRTVGSLPPGPLG
eukprot:207878-Prymnesium_polylepis.2